MLNFSATRISGSEHFPAFFRAVSHLRNFLVLTSRQEFSELLQHWPLPRPVIVANGIVCFQTFQSLSKIVEATEYGDVANFMLHGQTVLAKIARV